MREPGRGRQLLRGLGVSAEQPPSGAPRHLQLALELGGLSQSIVVGLGNQTEVGFGVDGRGEFSFALCRVADADGWGLWAGQRRMLPRPDRLL